MKERLFSKDHTWIIQDGDNAKIGISDFAQTKLKSILFLNLPEVGDTLHIGKRYGDIESIKTVSDLIAPVSGEVVKINEELLDDPSVINENPYDSWFLEVRVEEIIDGLMDEETYKGWL